MARRRTKKTKKTPETKGLQELGGFTIGDFIYCLRFPDKVISRGAIIGIFETKSGSFVDIIDEITGQYRSALLEDIIVNPTKKHINAANSKVVRNNKSAERVAEKKKLKKKR